MSIQISSSDNGDMFMDDVVKQGLTLNNHCGPTYKINDMFSLLTDVHLIACVDLTVT